MARLAVHHRGMDGTALRPSLRAALRLARDYEDFRPILKGITEGNLSIIARLFGECGSSPPALAEYLTAPGRSLAARIIALQPIALDLVYSLIGIDPDEKGEQKPAARSDKPFSYVEHFEALFGFATAILRWTPEATWFATTGEIMAAMEFRARAYAPARDDKAKPSSTLTLDEQAMLLSAQLDMRGAGNAD